MVCTLGVMVVRVCTKWGKAIGVALSEVASLVGAEGLCLAGVGA